MCLNPGRCREVSKRVRMQREFALDMNKVASDMLRDDRYENIKDFQEDYNKAIAAVSNAWGQFTKLVWQLCPDCRSVFFVGKDKRKEIK